MESAIEEACLQNELNVWLARNEIMWRQKSRETWLKDGDCNSQFFHISSIIRRKKNSIDAIRGDNGEWIVKLSEIREFVIEKFHNLFIEEDITFPEVLENLITPIILEDQNSLLCQIPTAKEIREVLFSMQSQKALDSDGLPPLFYKRYWFVVGSSVIQAVQKIFSSGKLLGELNNSYIVLIPKTPNPSAINHFRPISLCNTVYKIIFKLIVGRLRTVLPNLISPCQSAFILGRWIAEKQLIVQELLHSFKKRKVTGRFVALKLDLQKAYDHINWGFLKSVLAKFGFNHTFIGWITECVSTISFSILVNGGKSKHFKPTRGLWQGDPLSPYLFIICQEVLSRMIKREFLNGKIHGVKMNLAGLAFTHVMYADDIMIFAKTNSREIKILDECLDNYYSWSEQLINRDKSGIIFSKSVQRDKRREIKHILLIKKIQPHASYLGAPLFQTSSRKKDFSFLQDKLEARLLGWRSKAFSWVGKATMIRAGALALPTYTFSSSDVPIVVCDKMDASIHRFWWKPNKDSSRYLACRAWDDICAPKVKGGLGFRKLKQNILMKHCCLSWHGWLFPSKTAHA
jgi:hypothetical protein